MQKGWHSYTIFLLPLCSAILLGLSRIAIPLDMLSFVAFIPMFYYFQQISVTPIPIRTNIASGTIFSIVYLLISIHWITLVTVGGFLGMLFLFSIAFAVLFSVVSICYKYKPILYQISFIVAWLCFEYACNFSEFQFPWFCVGYGLNNSLSLLQVLELGGPIFLSFLILLVNLFFYLAFVNKRSFAVIAFTILIAWFAYGSLRRAYIVRHTVNEPLTAALIQGNIDQERKWQEAMIDSTFIIYESLARQAKADTTTRLMVFPEAALPVYIMHDYGYYQHLCSFVTRLQTPVFTGFPHFEREIKYKGQDTPYLYYNAANIFYPHHEKSPLRKGPYYKNILVPFGERTPLLNVFPLLWRLQMGQANFESGDSTVIYSVDDYKFAPLICFEVVFPYFLLDIVQKHNPDFFVNITNDAWFYRSIGTLQHANMAIFRTIELRKPIFRVANTGYSFYTSPDGSVHDITSLFARTFIHAKLQTFGNGKKTPYASYGHHIITLFLILFTLQILHILFIGYKNRPGAKNGKDLLHNL